jgi:hypothetical protein
MEWMGERFGFFLATMIRKLARSLGVSLG